MELLSMDYIWTRYRDLIRGGTSICDHLGVDFVGVDFKPKSNGTFHRQYIVVPRLAYGRGGDITYYRVKTLRGLLEERQIPRKKMSYYNFMQKFIRTNNYYCSRTLLDV